MDFLLKCPTWFYNQPNKFSLLVQCKNTVKNAVVLMFKKESDKIIYYKYLQIAED